MMQILVEFGLVIAVAFRAAANGTRTSSIVKLIDNVLEQNTSQVIIIAAALSLIIYIVLFSLDKRNLFEECRFHIIRVNQLVPVIFLAFGISMIIDGVLTLVPVDRWFPSHQQVVSSITASNSFILTFLAVGITAPVFEEILMRGLVYNELKRNINFKLAVVLQAIIFGLYHGNILQFIYATILGIFLAMVYEWTKSLWAPILIHILFNSSSLILGKLTLKVNILLYVAVGILFFSISIIYLYKLTHINERSKELDY
jgi:membrane protease YdiL (CAAX protease family)